MALYSNTKYALNGNGITLYGSTLDDMLVAGTGDQTLYGSSGNDLLIAGSGRQTLNGGSGADILVAGTGDQQLYGGSGNDTLFAGWGNQVLDGGSGIDRLDFSRLDAKIEFEQGARTAKVYDASTGTLLFTDTILSFDTIVGSDAGNTFHGQMWRATEFVGGKSADLFVSKSGGDTLTGNAGADTFVWQRKFVADGKTDTITDFERGVDKLDLADFLGQGFLNPTYAQVVRLVDVVDAAGAHGTLVRALVNERWADVVTLQHVDASTVTLNDLGLG